MRKRSTTRFAGSLRRSLVENGRTVAVIDFAYPCHMVAVEADGYRWHSGRLQWERDLARRNTLARLGWEVVHVTWEHLRTRPDDVVAQIGNALARNRPGVKN